MVDARIAAPGGGGQPVVYYEQGVAGTAPLAVYVSYDLRVMDDNPSREYEVPSVRVLGDPNLVLGSFAAVVGMPAMAGRLTLIDLTPMLDIEFIGVDFPWAAPRSSSSTPSSWISPIPPRVSCAWTSTRS